MTPNADTGGCYEWVVARPEKRNYLAHLARTSSMQPWATRSVKTLCGWVGFAALTIPDTPSGYDKDGWAVLRRKCKRCVKRAAGVKKILDRKGR